MPDSIKNIEPQVNADAQVSASAPVRTVKTAKTAKADTTHRISANRDTLIVQQEELTADSIAIIPSVAVGPPAPGAPVSPHPDTLASTPWLVSIMLLLFVLLSVRYRNNFRFLKSLVSDLVSVRQRNNMFDETVRETSFLITLDILCIAEVSIMAFLALLHFKPGAAELPVASTLAICMGCVAALYLVQWGAYNFCGFVFADTESRKMWVRAFATSQGLLSILLFPVTLAAIFNPVASAWLLWVGLACFLLARIVFIYKGFRIFFTQIGSWVLFLYYLCSLEVIPFILTAIGICALCRL